MNISDIYNNVEELAQRIGDAYSDEPFERLAYLAEELGEVARALINLRVFERDCAKTGRKAYSEIDIRRECLATESFDLMWNLFATLKSAGVTVEMLEDCAEAKMRRNKNRQFPTHGRGSVEEK